MFSVCFMSLSCCLLLSVFVMLCVVCSLFEILICVCVFVLCFI